MIIGPHTPLFRCAKPGGAGYYYGSRDAREIDCKATGCKWNIGGQCGVPSRAKFNAKASCEGFEPKALSKKPDGD